MILFLVLIKSQRLEEVSGELYFLNWITRFHWRSKVLWKKSLISWKSLLVFYFYEITKQSDPKALLPALAWWKSASSPAPSIALVFSSGLSLVMVLRILWYLKSWIYSYITVASKMWDSTASLEPRSFRYLPSFNHFFPNPHSWTPISEPPFPNPIPKPHPQTPIPNPHPQTPTPEPPPPNLHSKPPFPDLLGHLFKYIPFHWISSLYCLWNIHLIFFF